MATEQGIVNQATYGKIWVKIHRSKTCESCPSHADCKAMGSSQNDMDVELENTVGASAGDKVVLSMPTSSLLQLSFLMYVVPVIAMIIGGVVGQKMAPFWGVDETLSSVIMCLAFFGITIIIIRLMSNKLVQKNKYRPQIIRLIRQPQPLEKAEENTDEKIIPASISDAS